MTYEVVEKERIADRKHLILVDIKNRIGNQRIDFSIVTGNQVVIDPFFSSLLPSAIELHRWEQQPDFASS